MKFEEMLSWSLEELESFRKKEIFWLFIKVILLGLLIYGSFYLSDLFFGFDHRVYRELPERTDFNIFATTGIVIGVTAGLVMGLGFASTARKYTYLLKVAIPLVLLEGYLWYAFCIGDDFMCLLLALSGIWAYIIFASLFTIRKSFLDTKKIIRELIWATYKGKYNHITSTNQHKKELKDVVYELGEKSFRTRHSSLYITPGNTHVIINDTFEGTYENYPFLLHDFRYSYTGYDGFEIFRGKFLAVKLPQKFDGEFLINNKPREYARHYSTILAPELTRIDLGVRTTFTVSTTNVEAAQKICTLETIQKIQQYFGNFHVLILIKDDNCYCVFPRDRYLFEFPLLRALTEKNLQREEEVIESYVKMIDLIKNFQL